MDGLTATDNEQIKAAAVDGNRPPFDVVTGPADLVSFATHWISLCWHQLPDHRPLFHGKQLNTVVDILSLCFRINSASFTTKVHLHLLEG